MSGALYDEDALAWAEQQAGLLRGIAGGERLNDAVDWSNVIDEVQDVGLSELRACRSLLRHALAHLLNPHARPAGNAVGHWRGEVAGFLSDARDRYTPSMRQRIDMAELYADALYEIGASADESGPALPLPRTCPFSLDELLAPRTDVGVLVSRLR